MLKVTVTHVLRRLCYHGTSSVVQLTLGGVAGASEGRGGSVEICRAYEEVIRHDCGEKEHGLIKYSRSGGLSVPTCKMPGKKVCIVGSGNW